MNVDVSRLLADAKACSTVTLTSVIATPQHAGWAGACSRVGICMATADRVRMAWLLLVVCGLCQTDEGAQAAPTWGRTSHVTRNATAVNPQATRYELPTLLLRASRAHSKGRQGAARAAPCGVSSSRLVRLVGCPHAATMSRRTVPRRANPPYAGLCLLASGRLVTSCRRHRASCGSKMSLHVGDVLPQ